MKPGPGWKSFLHWVSVVFVLTLFIAACGDKAELSQAINDAAPPDLEPQHPGGSFGFTHFVFEEVGDLVVTSLVEGPRGPQVRAAVSLPGLKSLLGSGEPIPEALQIDRSELALLVDELDTVRASTQRYQDVNLALADGYVQVGGVVPNMGAHYVNQARVDDGVLNPGEPEIVLYDHDASGQWRLVGTAFVLPRETDTTSAVTGVGDAHPAGFAGPLDNWHVHYQLCTFPDGQFRTLSQVDCESRDGLFTPSYGWMIHAWVHDDNPLGVFSMWNANVPPTALGERGIRLSRNADWNPKEGTVSVAIENFTHSTVEVQLGESVTWVNSDGVPHTVTSGSGGDADNLSDSLAFGPGQTFTQQFDEVGTFSFTCTIHPQMNGTVIVE